jgi:hypothetical protein
MHESVRGVLRRVRSNYDARLLSLPAVAQRQAGLCLSHLMIDELSTEQPLNPVHMHSLLRVPFSTLFTSVKPGSMHIEFHVRVNLLDQGIYPST